jgi:hypothetical protein
MSRDRFLVRVPLNGRQFQVRGHRYTVLVKDATERSGVGGWIAQLHVTRDVDSLPVLLDITPASLSTMDMGSLVEGVLERLAEWVAMPETDRPDTVSV